VLLMAIFVLMVYSFYLICKKTAGKHILLSKHLTRQIITNFSELFNYLICEAIGILL